MDLSTAVRREVSRFEANCVLSSAIKLNRWLRFLPEHLGLSLDDAQRAAFVRATHLHLEAIKNKPNGPESRLVRSLVGQGAMHAVEAKVLDLWLQYARVLDKAERRCMRYLAFKVAQFARECGQKFSEESWASDREVDSITVDFMEFLVDSNRRCLRRMVGKNWQSMRRDWTRLELILRRQLNEHVQDQRRSDASRQEWNERNGWYNLFRCSQESDQGFCLGAGLCWAISLRVHALHMQHPNLSDFELVKHFENVVKGEPQEGRPRGTWIFSRQDRFLQACYEATDLELVWTRVSRDGRGPRLNSSSELDQNHLPKTLQRAFQLREGRCRIAARARRKQTLRDPAKAIELFLRRKLREGLLDETAGSTLVYYSAVEGVNHAFQVRLDRARNRWLFFDAEQGMYSYPSKRLFFKEMSAYLSLELKDISCIGIQDIFLDSDQA